MPTNTTITPNPGLYGTVFYSSDPDTSTLETYEAAVLDLADSGFMFFNLWFGSGLHVDVAGNFRVTSIPYPPLISSGALTSGYAYVPQLLSQLTGSGSSVRTLRVTLGGAGCDPMFNNMANLFALYGSGLQNPLYANFLALQELGIAGIDLDLEPNQNTP